MRPKEGRRMSKLILPMENGVPNFAIRRMQKELDEIKRNQRGAHPQTSEQISKALDKLRAMSDQGQLRSLLVVALLRPSRECLEQAPKNVAAVVAPTVEVIFACPRGDREMAVDLAQVSTAFIDKVMTDHFPAKPPDKSA
jgi:hypothetical protein